MKKLLVIIALGLFLITPLKADDIRDFQIEGMSIGDSLLDYVSKDEIEKRKKYYPKSKKWFMFAMKVSSFKTYDAFQVHVKEDDSRYIIGTLDGLINYENNIEDCYKKKDEIEIEISEIFKNAKKIEDVSKHTYDQSGKSLATSIEYWFESGDVAVLECIDWSEEIGLTDKLTFKMGTKEFVDWIQKEAYN